MLLDLPVESTVNKKEKPFVEQIWAHKGSTYQ